VAHARPRAKRLRAGRISKTPDVRRPVCAKNRCVTAGPVSYREVELEADGRLLPGMLAVPSAALGVIAFAHGSGSSRSSPRNQEVAAALNECRLATLLFDLLSEDEAADRSKVFDIPLLADRLEAATAWLATTPATSRLPVGLFGASTGAAAALELAASFGPRIAAVVSRGGRPDLATRAALASVTAPTLLIVGGRDTEVIALNKVAWNALRCEKDLQIVPGATHLFEEPDALEAVAALACQWFASHLKQGQPATQAAARSR